MPQGPAGGIRPASDSTLLLVIREIPVPTGDNEGVFPDPIIRNGADEEMLISDIASKTEFSEDSISVDITHKVQRGLGQTDTYKIRIDVSGMMPQEVDSGTDELIESGYRFEIVEFE